MPNGEDTPFPTTIAMIGQRQPLGAIDAPNPGRHQDALRENIADCDEVDSDLSTFSASAELFDDLNSSGETSCSASSSSTARKAAVFGNAKAFLKQKLGVLLLTQKPNEDQAVLSESPPQRIPLPSRRKQYSTELLAQPSMLVIPSLASYPTTCNRAVVVAEAGGATCSPESRFHNRRPPTERLTRGRPKRHLLGVEPSIPEEVSSFEEESLEFGGGVFVKASNTQDEVEREDTLFEQILEVFPDMDRRETYRLIREGRSVRAILSEFCVMRQAQPAQDLSATVAHNHGCPGAFFVSAAAEIEGMVQQIKEAFPEVDVDRSYELLQRNSMNSVMVQLAEESLNESSEFALEGDYNGRDEDRQVQYLLDAFPTVKQDKIQALLRQNSISTVVAQLCSASSDSGSQDDLRQSLLDYFRVVDEQWER